MTNSKQHPTVMVVDDDPDAVAIVRRWLGKSNLQVHALNSAEALLDGLSTTLPSCICLDLGLPGMSGMDALQTIRQYHRTVPVVIMTGDTSVNSIVAAIQRGAYDYLTKPLDRTKLVTTVSRAVERYEMSTRLAQLERHTAGGGFPGIVGDTPPMRRLYREMERVAASDITVLVHGESGTGKELVARAIHEASARSAGPMVAVNCAAIPETLQDSELFGHEKGAFTGAHSSRRGRFEQADGGTLFLDEVADLALPLQAKLLRVLQERRFERLGGGKELRSDFRLVAATHRDLAAMVKTGDFREDLFFRLAVFELEVPALRDRHDDVPLLAHAMLTEAHQDVPAIEATTMTMLQAHSWPGNVRELHNVLQRAALVADGGRIRPIDLPPRLRTNGDVGALGDLANDPAVAVKKRATQPMALPSPAPQNDVLLARPHCPEDIVAMAEVERRAILAAVDAAGGNLTEVIRRLHIGRTTLYRKLKKYGVR